MLELYIIRHGFAGKSNEGAADDDLRPLKKKGKEQMKDVGRSLKKWDVALDAVLTSPLVRAKESAEILNAECGKSKKVILTDLLKPGASFSKLIKHLNDLKKAQRVAIVGHEPFLSEFASHCLSKNGGSFINLRKGGVIKLDIDKVIKPGNCILSWLLEPSLLI